MVEFPGFMILELWDILSDCLYEETNYTFSHHVIDVWFTFMGLL